MRMDCTETTILKSITVAICTFRRPDGLKRLLLEFGQQKDLSSYSVRMVVVDNDPEATARPVVEEVLSRGYPYPVDYFVEMHPGVAHARNRCLAESCGDYMAFIDDDEIPTEAWLAELIKSQIATQADVVCGPVLPKFDSPPPGWVLEAQFFERKRHPDNTRITWLDSRTGNVLFSREVVDLAGGGFDERFSASGAEDALFFYRAERRGASIYWADQACVYEYIPDSRVSLKWFARRAYKGGQNWVRIRAESNRYIWLPMALRGLGTLIAAAIVFVPVLLVSRAHASRLAVRMAGDVGKMTAWKASTQVHGSYACRHYTG